MSIWRQQTHTQMIVFPLIRSVGLKAATPWSRAAMLAMFVRKPTILGSLDDLAQLGAIGDTRNRSSRRQRAAPLSGRSPAFLRCESGPRPFHDVAADDVSGSIASQLAREADAYVIGTGSFRSDRRSPFRPADTRVARPGAKQHRFEARQPTPCPGANCDNG